MVAGALRKKRPCSVCRQWFLPDARVGNRQRACSAPECQRARHREADRAWHARHRDYDRGRRWQVAVDAAKPGSPPPDHPPPLPGLPSDVAQGAMTSATSPPSPPVATTFTDYAATLKKRAGLPLALPE